MALRRSGKQSCAAVASLLLAACLSAFAADPCVPPSEPPAALPAREAPSAPETPVRLDKAQVRALVERFAQRYGIPEHAGSIAKVIHMESRGFTQARSRSGRYVGMCQFMPRTFRVNVELMKRAGLLPPDGTFSPLNPEHAVHVMVWMWSQGEQRQWGPARRMQIAQVTPPPAPGRPVAP